MLKASCVDWIQSSIVQEENGFGFSLVGWSGHVSSSPCIMNDHKSCKVLFVYPIDCSISLYDRVCELCEEQKFTKERDIL